jgi:predicted dehydrogenase
MNLGVIGSSQIVSHHLDSLINTGFIPAAIGTRKNSTRSLLVGEKYNFKNICNSWEEVLNQNIDALLIASKTDFNYSILMKALEKGIPILIEKPVSTDLDELKEVTMSLNSDLVQVGYNRRFYSSVQKIRSEISLLENYYFEMKISELSHKKESNLGDRKKSIVTNSVHMLDLAIYLFGNLRLDKIDIIKTNDNLDAISVNCLTSSGIKGNLLFTFGIPLNNSIQVISNGLRLNLMPVEHYSQFDKMTVIPSSAENPIRTYLPETTKSAWKISLEDKNFKPGFLAQSRYFQNKVAKKENPSDLVAATLEDALIVMKLCHKILNEF